MNNQLAHTAFAILYRTNAQSRSLEDALRRMNIPCRIYGGQSFYQRKEIKDLLAYFRLVVNPKDEDALLRVINYPARGIGKTTVEKLIVASDEYKKSIYEILEDPGSYPVHLAESTSGKLTSFITMIRSFSVLLKTKPAFDMAKHIATSTGLLKEMYEDKTPEGVSRFENIEELLNAIREFTEKKISPAIIPLSDAGLSNGENPPQSPGEEEPGTLDRFMQDIALLTDQDTSDSENQDRVTLMTIHAAKGLEFPFVYVVGMEENLFPSVQSLSSRADLEEERRLFYVAITRAQVKLTLSYAENRYRWGNLTSNEPSRFLQEIPEKHIDYPQKPMGRQTGFLMDDNFSGILAGKEPPKPKAVNLKNFHRLNHIQSGPAPSNSSGDDIQVGMEVEHERFGKGKVISMEGTGPNTKATVFFSGIGQKQLLLRFARLKIV
jgi:DNA helicase-2/ATP-dependent DNA helicase PcrA